MRPQLGHDRRDRLVGALEVDAGLREERARLDVLAVLGADVVRQAAALAHLGEETRRHAAAEHRREHRGRVAVGVRRAAGRRRRCGCGTSRTPCGGCARAGAARAATARARRSRRPAAAPNSSSTAASRRVRDGAAEADDRARGHVPAAEVVRERLARGRAHRLGRADDVAAERRVAVAEAVVHAREVARRRVEVHVHLLDDHALLALDLLGVEERVQQHVAEHVDRDGHVLLRALDVVAGVFLAGERVELGADAVDLGGDHARRRAALGALEEEVLGEVRDAAGRVVLVARADRVHDHHAGRLGVGLRGGEKAGSIVENAECRTRPHGSALPSPCRASSRLPLHDRLRRPSHHSPRLGRPRRALQGGRLGRGARAQGRQADQLHGRADQRARGGRRHPRLPAGLRRDAHDRGRARAPRRAPRPQRRGAARARGTGARAARAPGARAAPDRDRARRGRAGAPHRRRPRRPLVPRRGRPRGARRGQARARRRGCRRAGRALPRAGAAQRRARRRSAHSSWRPTSHRRRRCWPRRATSSASCSTCRGCWPRPARTISRCSRSSR